MNPRKREQLSILVRYFFEGEMHEEFIDFRAAKDLTAERLCGYIQEELKSSGIDII